MGKVDNVYLFKLLSKNEKGSTDSIIFEKCPPKVEMNLHYNGGVKLSEKSEKRINEFAIDSPIEYYTTPVITEAKSIIKFNNNGDALLTKPIMLLNLDDEYAQSHKLLMNYEKKFMFKDQLTQKLFDKCIKEIKGIKG